MSQCRNLADFAVILSDKDNVATALVDLPAGEYIFMIRARNRDGIYSSTISLPIHISKQFTKTTFFYVIIILVALIIIVFGFFVFYVNQQRKAKLQRKVMLAEQKAVLSQMNPHFIFNSLNSIQNFILNKDDKNANTYLVIFSSLIRKILEISQKNFITLQEELDTVKLYLDLEKFRFDGKFDYTINIADGILPANITIPSLILQPFLENAIWHGIIPKNQKGSIQLEIQNGKDNMLMIRIIDDGVGREKAAEINKKRAGHKPRGMKNVSERLHLLNELNNTNMSVSIIDLYDGLSNPCGTKVVFDLDIHIEKHTEV
jgi:LytS/YehU family sensor histidine kinase